MYAQQDASSEHAKKLRKLGGQYIRRLREASELTQRDLAERCGFKYYTFISQIENGSGRPPPHLYEVMAKTLNVPVAEFTKHMLMYYDPFVYKGLFGVPSQKELKSG